MWDVVGIAVLCLAFLIAASHYMWSDTVVIAGLCGAPLIYYALLNVHAHYFVFGPMREARKHLTFADFQREFEGSDYGKEAIELAYQDLTEAGQLPVVRSDHLWNTLHLDRGDFEDSVHKRVSNLAIDVCSSVPINTVEGYVTFLSYVLKYR